MFLREEIKDYLIRNCTSKNLPYDLAKIFITQDGIVSDDLFQYKYSLENDIDFYKNLFEYLFNYAIDQIEKGRLNVVCRDIINKLSCHRYYIDFNNQVDYVENDYIISKWLEDLALYIKDKYDFYEFINYINILRTTATIDQNIIKNIILQNEQLYDYDILKTILEDNMMDSEFICELFIKLYPYYSKYMLHELVLILWNHKEIFINFVTYILDKYSYSINEDRTLFMYIKNQYEDCPQIVEALTFLRTEISELIQTDVELDIFEHINNALANYMVNSKAYGTNIWKNIRKWLSSKERKEDRIKNFSKHATEDDPLSYSDEMIGGLNLNVFTLAYINDLKYLDGWSLFVRMFNLNRFYFTHTRNQLRIEFKLEELIDVYSDYVKLATNMKLYLFIYDTNSEQI